MVEDESMNQWSKKLNENVSGGGGCAEAWEAAENQRNTGRRTFLAGVIGSLLTGVSASKVLAAGGDDIPAEGELETVVEELDGRARDDALANLLSDPEAHQIHTELASQASRVDRSAAKAYRARYQDQAWEVVTLPYAIPIRESSHGPDPRTNIDAGVTWSSRDDFGAVGYVAESTPQPGRKISQDVQEAIDQSNINYSSQDATPYRVSLTTVTADGSSLQTRTNSRTIPIQGSSTSNVSPEADLSDCACTVYTALCSPCGLPDWGCINTLAGAYAGEIAACSACYSAPSQLTCVPCLGTVIEQLASGETPICCFCNAFDPPDIPWPF